MNAHPDLHFGALAVQNGFASPSEVALALETQKEGPAFESEAPQKLGEILAEMGALTREQIRALLDAQARLRAGASADPSASTTQLPVAFEEIDAAALDQEAGPPLTVNDEPLSAPRLLKAGDRLKAGELVLRFSGDSLEVRPKEPAASPTEPATPEPSFASKLLPVLRAVDGLIARIPPALHPQRKYVLAAGLIGALAFVLPWRIAANGNSVLGIQGPGWVPFLLGLVPVALTLLTRAVDPFTRTERIVSSAAAGLTLLILAVKFLVPPSYATARGAGLYLAILSTAAVLAAGAFPRAAGTSSPGDSATLGGRLWKKLSGLLGTVSGRRARELSAAMEQRDGLLRKLGEAVLEAHGGLPEAAAAVQARDAFRKAEQDAGDPAAANVRAKAALKAADAKARRAFGKLAQRALDDGLALGGQESTIAELRAAEARIKELS
jgi:hypothetical protein